SACRMSGRKYSFVQYRILEKQVRNEHPEGSPQRGNAPRNGLGGPLHLGVRNTRRFGPGHALLEDHCPQDREQARRLTGMATSGMLNSRQHGTIVFTTIVVGVPFLESSQVVKDCHDPAA